VDVLRDLDRNLARLSHLNGARRLRVGQALCKMSERSWHHELGFSSLPAYALERCAHKGRWAAESCTVARKLAKLPRLRAALETGTLGWSMVELLARHATPENEAELMAEAAGSTVRRMQERLLKPTSAQESPSCAITVTVDADDAWTAECTRWLFDRMEPHATTDEFVHALLAEGVSSLFELVPSEEMTELQTRVDALAEREAAWRAEREAWCAEAQVESRLDLVRDWERASERGADAITECKTPAELDALLVSLSREMTQSDLLLGELADRFWRADGWRRLGYASERQYARERLGMSVSSIKSKRFLARRSQKLPRVAEALERRVLGFEAAVLVSRIATATTVDAWLERAQKRTVKLLREEVDAAELAIRFGASRAQLPPSAEAIESLAEARLATSRGLAGLGQISASPASAPAASAPAASAPPRPPSAPQTFAQKARALLSQMSALPGRRKRVVPRHDKCTGAERGFGRVALRFTVSEDTRDLWHAFDECFAKVRGFLPGEPSMMRFLCATFHVVWGHAIDPKVKYGHIYARDGFVCRSPLCSRRDVTPHHLWFRSAGGGEEDENLASLCLWCHLHGIHEGRIKAQPPASDIRWELGRQPLLIVDGRTLHENQTAERTPPPGL
jgi:hypothetical protein